MPENNREIAELQSIVTSKLLLDELNKHKAYLQKDVNKFVKAQNLIEAFAALAKLEDFDNVIRLLIKRIDELKKGEQDGG